MLGEHKFIQAYQHFINSKDVLELLCLKFMFLGPPRLGKSTTLRRVIKEIINLKLAGEEDKIHGSTGTVKCCSNVIVRDDTEWSAVHNFIDEACVLFHSLKNSLHSRSITLTTANSSTAESATVAEVSQASSTEQNRVHESASQSGLLHELRKSMVRSERSASASEKITPPAQERAVHIQKVSPDYSEIAAIFKEASQNPKFAEDLENSFKALLRMEDTGGQPELMDMLPALTIGPGLYLLFFSYEFKLDEEYQVFYQRATGEQTVPEQSAFTLQVFLLCTLSSISCSNATKIQPVEDKEDNSNMSKITESSKSVVFIVGTHKDKVSDEYIATVDKKLQEVIENTDFYRKGIVQFCSNDKLVVSLDNMEGGIEEVQELHQLLEKAMEKHFKKLKIPAVWLLFSLCLRMRDVRTASIQTCLELSKAFSMTKYETEVALWFLHHHAGVLMYFPSVPGLEDLVIIDIQVVYDSITGVILQCMKFHGVGRAKAERFRKTGQFSFKDLLIATCDISADLMSPHRLVALLKYLHIICEILCDGPSSTEPQLVAEEDSEYFMPCVLESTSCKELDLIHKEACRSCFVLPLSVYFTCGFTPIGLFPALIACLFSNKSFTLIREGIKKNMVQFLFEAELDVTFLCRPKYYEIIASCQPILRDSLHKSCTALKSAIKSTLKLASSRMNYSSYMDYQFGFECTLHEEGGHLGIVDQAKAMPRNMICINNPNKPMLVILQNKHFIWYGQVRVARYIKQVLLLFYHHFIRNTKNAML